MSSGKECEACDEQHWEREGALRDGCAPGAGDFSDRVRNVLCCIHHRSFDMVVPMLLDDQIVGVRHAVVDSKFNVQGIIPRLFRMTSASAPDNEVDKDSSVSEVVTIRLDNPFIQSLAPSSCL